ncbi:MAG TPA: hypothetical protein VIO94_11140 [Phenylobacterium sp.]
MSTETKSQTLAGAWLDAMQAWAANPFPALAPRRLDQDILPGWRLGDVYFVGPQNSSSPETERQIVAEQSYGRQLGRVLDALCVLIDERPKEAAPSPALKALTELRDEIEVIKQRSAAQRLEGLAGDLATLRREQPETYRRLIRKLAQDLE